MAKLSIGKDNDVSKNRARHVVGENTPFIIAEAYKMARTNLIFALSTSPNKIIYFTSSGPGEGKTTTCCNMAITLADLGSKVLLIDADLRKPSIHKMLKLENKKGLTTIISSQCSINEARNISVRENLDVITAGPIPPNPSELISSSKMQTILSLLEKKYDYICIDTPPVNVVGDALSLNTVTAGCIFVVREGVTTHNAIAKAINSIGQTNGKILGMMKVNCNPNEKSSKGYSYHYKYDYSYSYSAKHAEQAEKHD